MDQLESWDLSGKSDEHLLRGLKEFVAIGARADARVVAHLAEVEERRLHLRAACSSLFDYCVRRLGLSESEAFHRITASRLARNFPLTLQLLEARSIHLSALRLLRDHLTHENHLPLLAAASGKTKREVEQLVVTLSPRPDVAARIRKQPATRRAESLLNEAGAPATHTNRSSASSKLPLGSAKGADDSVAPMGRSTSLSRSATQSATLATPTPPAVGEAADQDLTCTAAADNLSAHAYASRLRSEAAPARSAARARSLEALSPSRYLLRMSVSREFTEKLERARALMSHANPSGELELMLEKALDLLLEKLEKQRFAQTKCPRTPSGQGARGSVRVPPSRELSRTARHRNTERATPEVVRPSVANAAERAGAAGEKLRSSSSKGTEGMSEGAVGSAPRSRPDRREAIPNEVRRAVAARDGFQCTYVDDAGHRCPSRAFLQLHHERAHALGGPSTFENLRLLCGSHNRLLAEQDFGRPHQERFASRERDRARSTARELTQKA